MARPPSLIRDWTKQLSAATRTQADPEVHDAAALIERLQVPLTRFCGAEGFASLLRRALALASAEDPSLRSVKVGADGRLEGFDQAPGGPRAVAKRHEAANSITAHLLALLVAFIGEHLTRKLVVDASTERSPDERKSGTESAP
jgi:hypothetical protein